MMKLFNQGTLKNYLTTRLAYLRDEVQAEDRDKLLNVNETEYVDYLVEQYKIDPLRLDCDQLSVSDREEMFPPEAFPRGGYDIRRGQLYRKQVITYHVSYSGNADLLEYSPTMRQAFWEQEVERNRDSICFEIVAAR
jgi:hypothetical protein